MNSVQVVRFTLSMEKCHLTNESEFLLLQNLISYKNGLLRSTWSALSARAHVAPEAEAV